MWETGGIEDVQTGLPCTRMNACWPGVQRPWHMLHSQASGLSVDLTDARTQQRRGEAAEHVPLCWTAVSSVSMHHSYLKPNKTIAIMEKIPKYLVIMQQQRWTHATTLQTRTSTNCNVLNQHDECACKSRPTQQNLPPNSCPVLSSLQHIPLAFFPPKQPASSFFFFWEPPMLVVWLASSSWYLSAPGTSLWTW